MIRANDSLNDIDIGAESIPPRSLRQGYRLHRLEVYNWGTFDSTDGNVHTMPIGGETTLLVGHNESGKSTLVDALLTLLVRPGISRNFNVAAGAGKGERTERTYIRGAYERRSSDESGSEIKYLREAHGYYSALLACFHNEATGGVFTLAVILYLTSDNSVEKLYCFAPGERSIAKNCSGITGMDKLAKQMQARGFPKTSKSYSDYFEWFRKATGVQPQAMDMFNQTVAVKDIQRLNEFIRKHMLEAKPWAEKVDELLRHFQDLSDAHRDLLRVQKQHTLLIPIDEGGAEYSKLSEQLRHVDRLIDDAEAYFNHKIIEIYSSSCEEKGAQLAETGRAREKTTSQLDEVREEGRRIQNEIDQAGGDRLRRIPDLINAHRIAAAAKKEHSVRFQDALRRAGIARTPVDNASLQTLRRGLPARSDELRSVLHSAELERRVLIHQHGETVRALTNEEAELKALEGRRENVPVWLGDLRRQLCNELRLNDSELRFVAELIAVKQTERAWEPSIEMLLRGFALTLLIPDRHYNLVSSYIERSHLRDNQGRGQKLVYHRIGQSRSSDGSLTTHDKSLLNKIEFRSGHAFLPWVKGELQSRFNYLCCETIEDFQLARERAVTRERHVKHMGGRHEKDDRDQFLDRRRFVLGWDNREKRQSLEQGIRELRQTISNLDTEIQGFDQQQNNARDKLQAIQEVLTVSNFSAIDFLAEEKEIASLTREKQALEDNNEIIRVLKRRRSTLEKQVKQLEATQEGLIRDSERIEGEIKTGQQIIRNAKQVLSELRAAGTLSSAHSSFAEIDACFVDDSLTWDNIFNKQATFEKKQKAQRVKIEAEIAPIQEQLHKAMSLYLRTFPDDKLELTADVKYLGDFQALLKRIKTDDLPRHEKRFKERLNEKVGEDVGLLRSAFETERAEIEDRIELLNRSLRQLHYQPDTHMRLEAQHVRDREIVEFRQSLYDCVSGAFDGTTEANEQRYLRIEKLIIRLRDEDTWRRKVTDVRNWFDFAAVEIDEVTGEERSYHEDSSGKSGGGKAKLAFTILVAAIAYQYDLQPELANASRFHFVTVDEMFSRIDDRNSKYALDLFAQFALQLLIVAPLDAKARITEPYVGRYLHVIKHPHSNKSEVFHLTATEFNEKVAMESAEDEELSPTVSARRRAAPK